jgi:tetratricopeptide (TPR) repeat protein
MNSNEHLARRRSDRRPAVGLMLAFGFLGFCILTPAVKAQDFLPELVQRIKPSAVAIETFGARGERISRGSGFFIATGQVITNRHVIENAVRVDVHLANGSVYSVKGVLAVDGEGDLAMLLVELPAGLGVPLPMDRTIPLEGESIVVIGNPFGLEGSVSNGIVSAVREIPGYGRIIQITAPISPGSSGSPVVNMRGQVIGVATLQASEGQSLNFAVPSERVGQLKPGVLQTFAGNASASRRSKRANAEPYYAQGLGFLSRDEWTKAVPYFERATDADPDYAEAWYQTGFCYGMLGRHNEALKASRQALRLKPDWSEAYVNIGASLYALGQFKDAVEAYRQAIKLDQTNADAQFALGLTFGKLGRTDEELLAYKRTIALKPDHANAFERLGTGYFKQKRYPDALAAFEQLRLLKASDAKVYNYLGETYIELERYEEASQSLQQALGLNSDFGKARYNLGRVYLKQGNRDASVAQYNMLKDAESEWADKLYVLIYP